MPGNKSQQLSRDRNSHGVSEVSFCLLLAYGRWFLMRTKPMGLHLSAVERLPCGKIAVNRHFSSSSLPDFFGIDQYRESIAEGALQYIDSAVTAAQDFHVGQVYHDSALSKKWTKKADGSVLPEQMIS
ncbi:MAG: hypothetical protein ACYDBT_11835 [Desulfobulbaceae bacterium]